MNIFKRIQKTSILADETVFSTQRNLFFPSSILNRKRDYFTINKMYKSSSNECCVSRTTDGGVKVEPELKQLKVVRCLFVKLIGSFVT